jgi:hypothetical protein
MTESKATNGRSGPVPTASAGAGVLTGRFRRESDPHRWWRIKPADVFSDDDLAELDRAIERGPAFLHARWPAARRGDAAAAIGVAMDTCRAMSVPRRTTDVVMTAVLLNAVRDDSASRIVMCHVLRRIAARNRAYGTVAQSWMARVLKDSSA